MATRTDRQLSLRRLGSPRRRGGLVVQDCEALVARLRDVGARVAGHFGLPPFDLDADRPDARSRYGVCDEDGRIRVRLVHARTGRPLRYSALVDTVIHELAHLRHLDHGERWEALYHRMLDWARAQGLYAPREPAPPAPDPEADPDQLRLF